MKPPHGLKPLPAGWRPELDEDDPRRGGIDAVMGARYGEHGHAIAEGNLTVRQVRRRAFIDLNMALADREFEDQVAALAATETERDVWLALARFNGASAPTLPSGTDRAKLAAAGVRHRRARRELIDAALAAGYEP